MAIRFGVIGLNHNHIYEQTRCLLEAGAELVWCYASEPDLVAEFLQKFPQAKRARSAEEILEDKSIDVVANASIPADRAPLGIQVMQHGKDYMTDKPGFTTLEQLAEVRKVQQQTGRMYHVFFTERLTTPVSIKAGELIKAGAIGRVLQTVGFGPHRLGASRPDWFYQKQRYGGIITDIASHQLDQFLFFTGSTQAEIVSSQVANFNHPQHPELEDFGDLVVRSPHATGYIRVDWYTPNGLPVWGDGRIFILGTEGTLELRKYCDVAGRQGGNHLFLVDQKHMEYINCDNVPLPYGRQFLDDVRNRTETSMSQAHCFLASELALVAEKQATVIGQPSSNMLGAAMSPT